MSVTHITLEQHEEAFRQSQQQNPTPAHKKVSKKRLERYKPYMQLEKK